MFFKKEIFNFSNLKNKSFILNYSESFVVKDVKHDLEILLNYIYYLYVLIIIIFKRKIFYLEFD